VSDEFPRSTTAAQRSDSRKDNSCSSRTLNPSRGATSSVCSGPRHGWLVRQGLRGTAVPPVYAICPSEQHDGEQHDDRSNGGEPGRAPAEHRQFPGCNALGSESRTSRCTLVVLVNETAGGGPDAERGRRPLPHQAQPGPRRPWAAEARGSGAAAPRCRAAPNSSRTRSRWRQPQTSSRPGTPAGPSAPTARRPRWTESSTAGDRQAAPARVRVTHPFHPLSGREFEFAFRRVTWGRTACSSSMLTARSGLAGATGRPKWRHAKPTRSPPTWSTAPCPQRAEPAVGDRHRAPRGALEPCGGEGHRRRLVVAGRLKLRAA
jgi:hypothetical protein